MADAHLMRLLRSNLAYIGNTTPSVSNFNISSTTHGVAAVLMAETNSPIVSVGFRYGARTGTTGSLNYVVGIEGVSASTGFPSGTYKQNGGTDCKATFTAPNNSSLDGTWQEVTLDASYAAVTFGEKIALTIRTSDGGVSGAQYMSVGTNADNQIGWANTNFPYAGRLTSGTWSITFSGSSAIPIFGYATSADYFGYPYLSNYATATASTVGRRIGAVFNLPSNKFYQYKVRGFTFVGSWGTAGGKNPVAGLWNAGGVLQNVTLDTNIGRSAGNALRQSGPIVFDESSLSTLSGGTDYYIGLEVADAASSSITLNGINYNSTTQAAADGGGNALIGVATYDGSNWSTDFKARPFIELILDDITLPSGSSGGIVIGG